MQLTKWIRTAVMVGVAMAAGAAGAWAEVIVPFDIPGMPDGSPVMPKRINNAGVVVGDYVVLDFVSGAHAYHAFLRMPDGTIQTIDPPEAMSTSATGITETGLVSGYFYTEDGPTRGFIRSADGVFTIVDIPGALAAALFDINEQGEALGIAYLPGEESRPFVRHVDGTIESIQVGSSRYTLTGGINDAGVTTGSYHQGPLRVMDRTQAFVRTPDGHARTVPVGTMRSVYPGRINNAGAIAAVCVDQAMAQHGCVLKAGQSAAVFDAPAAIDGTIPVDINASGTTAGYFLTRAPEGWTEHHGFIRTSDGTLTPIDVAGGGVTDVTGINDDGVVIGTVYLNTGTLGFIRFP